jgi:hypothetical protein
MEPVKLDALAQHLQCTTEEAKGIKDDYLVYTDEEADEACQEYIKDSVWAFNPHFILSECGLDGSGVDYLRQMQEKFCESANDFILSLIESTCGLDEFVNLAISADGRGHFLASYDGHEYDIETENDGTFYVYRTN